MKEIKKNNNFLSNVQQRFIDRFVKELRKKSVSIYLMLTSDKKHSVKSHIVINKKMRGDTIALARVAKIDDEFYMSIKGKLSEKRAFMKLLRNCEIKKFKVKRNKDIKFSSLKGRLIPLYVTFWIGKAKFRINHTFYYQLDKKLSDDVFCLYFEQKKGEGE